MTPDLRLSLLKYGKDNAKKQGWEQKREFSHWWQGILHFVVIAEGKDKKKQPRRKLLYVIFGSCLGEVIFFLF